MASKHTCGTIIPSSCVPYTGKDLKFLSTEDQPACDANIDEVIEKISIAIDTLQDATDVTDYDLDCVEHPVGNKTIVTISQAQNEKICALQAQLTALQSQFAAYDIGTEQITVDLGCLASAAAPCQVSTNTYTLASIITLFANEICAIKDELNL